MSLVVKSQKFQNDLKSMNFFKDEFFFSGKLRRSWKSAYLTRIFWVQASLTHFVCIILPGMDKGTGIPWDLCPGILLGRLGLGQISLGQSRDKNLWDSQIRSFGTSWDSSPWNFGVPRDRLEFLGTCVPWDFESQRQFETRIGIVSRIKYVI